MSNDSDDLNIREDDWSFQITSPGSDFFFVRLPLPLASASTVTFSDFVLRTGDERLGLAALHKIFDRFQLALAKKKLVFDNIYPGYSNDNDRDELVRRHDQIVSVVREFVDQKLHGLKNAYMDASDGKFFSVIEFK